MFELVGIQEVNFKDDKGNQIVGKKIHFLTDPDPSQKQHGFTGKIAASKFFGAGAIMPPVLQCGKHYEFLMSYTGGTAPKLTGFKEVKV